MRKALLPWIQKGNLDRKFLSFLISKEFQLRHAVMVFGAACVGLILSLGPTLFFIDQNYDFFIDLAYQHNPELLQNLEREKNWVITILFANFLGSGLFFAHLSFKLTHRIIGPVSVLKFHMNRMARGDWRIKKLRVRENDEFQDLISSYNYLIQSIRLNSENEIKELTGVKENIQDEKIQLKIQDLIEKKCELLDEPAPEGPLTTLSALDSDPSPASPRAS